MHRIHQTLATLIKQTSASLVYLFKHKLMCCVRHAAIFGRFYSSTVADSLKGGVFCRPWKVHKKLWSCWSQNQKLGPFVSMYNNRKPSNYTDGLNVEGEQNGKSLSKFSLHWCCVRFPGWGGVKTAPEREEDPDSAVWKAAALTTVPPFPPGLPWLQRKAGTNGPFVGIYVAILMGGHVERLEAAPKNSIFSSSGRPYIQYLHIHCGIKNSTL